MTFGYHSSGDLNDFIQSGIYKVGNSLDFSHLPNTQCGYSNMLTLRGGGDTIAQLLIPYNHGTIYFRYGTPPQVVGKGSYSQWYKLVGTT